MLINYFVPEEASGSNYDVKYTWKEFDLFINIFAATASEYYIKNYY